jgi:hypothetical protein
MIWGEETGKEGSGAEWWNGARRTKSLLQRNWHLRAGGIAAEVECKALGSSPTLQKRHTRSQEVGRKYLIDGRFTPTLGNGARVTATQVF